VRKKWPHKRSKAVLPSRRKKWRGGQSEGEKPLQKNWGGELEAAIKGRIIERGPELARKRKPQEKKTEG